MCLWFRSVKSTNLLDKIEAYLVKVQVHDVEGWRRTIAIWNWLLYIKMTQIFQTYVLDLGVLSSKSSSSSYFPTHKKEIPDKRKNLLKNVSATSSVWHVELQNFKRKWQLYIYRICAYTCVVRRWRTKNSDQRHSWFETALGLVVFGQKIPASKVSSLRAHLCYDANRVVTRMTTKLKAPRFETAGRQAIFVPGLIILTVWNI